METYNRVGEVNRPTLGALKKLCDYNLDTVMVKLDKFHNIWRTSATKYKLNKRTNKQSNGLNISDKALFSEETIKEMLYGIQEQRDDARLVEDDDMIR